jgi:hypothetical protein
MLLRRRDPVCIAFRHAYLMIISVLRRPVRQVARVAP